MLDDVLTIDQKHLIRGEIYVITNKINGKQYVGQTLTHRLNKNKYRPFGYTQRFLDHISEAFGKKKKQSRYLNNALRKYNREKFSVELVIRCSIHDLDQEECRYISEYQSLYPNGYNLTRGGKGARHVPYDIIATKVEISKIPYQHSDQTKQKISKQLKKAFNTPEIKKYRKSSALEQHEKTRILKFANISIDPQIDITQLIHPRMKCYYIKIQNIDTRFYFKTDEDKKGAYKRAITFLKKLKQQNQIAGSH